MIVVCSQCTTRLQLDDAKLPQRAFTLRCPKCQSIINAQPPAPAASEQSALAIGESPAVEHPRFKQPVPAPPFNPEDADESADVEAYAQKDQPAADQNELVRMLAMLLQSGGGVSPAPTNIKQARAGRLAWERRRALVCVTPQHRHTVARILAGERYQVFVAEDTTQAIERMRDDHMDVVVLDPSFDPVEQGAAFVTREVNILRPAERRRLFFVHLSASARTLDSHSAFVSNVNLVINPADLDNLPQVLERGLRDFNDLYREFNDALGVAAI